MAKNKIFCAQPMHGLTLKEVIKVREDISKTLQTNGYDIEVIDNLQTNEEYIANTKKHPRLWYLGESIKLMSEAQCIIFASGWKNFKGCLIEKEIANLYSIPIIDMEEPNWMTKLSCLEVNN